jgi:hypothetical protein
VDDRAPFVGSPSTSAVGTCTFFSARRACGSPFVSTCRSSVTPAAFGSTRKTPTSWPPVVAGTRMRAASSPAGTTILAPLRIHPAPSRCAAVCGRAGSSCASSVSAAVRIVVPAATPGSHAFCCAALPKCAIGSAPSTSDASTGTCATARPISLAEEAELDEAHAGPAVRLGHRDAEQARLRERVPRRLVDPLAGRFRPSGGRRSSDR